MISLREISEKLFNEKSVALFCHVRPDGDTVGSALALKLALGKKGIKADVFSDDVMPARFSYINAINQIKNSIDQKYSAYIAIDCADITRLGKFAEEFSAQKNTYNLDHHVSNDCYGRYNAVYDNAANCENVYDVITYAGITPDKEIAECLATGLVTDTGAFKHKNVTAKTFKIAAELLSCGADFNKIVYCNFSAQSKERAALFGTTMTKLRYFLDDRLCIGTVRMSDVEKCGAKPDETEGFIDFILGIDCVEVAITILETDKNKFKVSFRAKNTDVNAIASEFGGGGHVLASGCKICGEYEEVVDKLRYQVGRYIKD